VRIKKCNIKGTSKDYKESVFVENQTMMVTIGAFPRRNTRIVKLSGCVLVCTGSGLESSWKVVITKGRLIVASGPH